MCVAPAPQCLPVPSGVDLVEAGGDSRNLLHRLDQRLRSRTARGRRDGALSRRIERHRHDRDPAGGGARRTVLATAGSDEKCRACEDLGAEQAINYRTRTSSRPSGELTDGSGVDLILDIVGGSYVARNLAALAIDGRLVQIGLHERRVHGARRFPAHPDSPADDHRVHAAAADRRGEGADRRGPANRGLAAARRAAPSGRRPSRRFRWPRPPRRIA